jgi:hypothetical protein
MADARRELLFPASLAVDGDNALNAYPASHLELAYRYLK